MNEISLNVVIQHERAKIREFFHSFSCINDFLMVTHSLKIVKHLIFFHAGNNLASFLENLIF